MDALLVQRGIQSGVHVAVTLLNYCVSSNRSCCIHTGDAGPLNIQIQPMCLCEKYSDKRKKGGYKSV